MYRVRNRLRSGMSVDAPIRALFASGEAGAWYDPGDLSTLFQDAAGATPVTATGQPVGKMLDKSGRGSHATQATAGSRPLLQQDAAGRYYLAFDGVDDFMQTGSINFSGNDKMAVFAGVRKLVDGVDTILAELSANAGANSGSFFLQAPGAASNYYFRSNGTAASDVGVNSGYASPISSVITATGNISGSSSVLRVNGAQVASNAISQGTGNFGNYPLYIGARSGPSLPFNGRLYSLIVRGALCSLAQIADAERYVNGRTGAY